ncbi:long-chain-fatty-acid--CoA ligase ACSBG2-like [Pelobates fuscus]|uniref:long-chain-fatty-acid--CoA ligase ACSBG2-like n=1 Tax=Pelobates fuscus TaxID=191477 RepID=UPI002FE4B235
MNIVKRIRTTLFGQARVTLLRHAQEIGEEIYQGQLKHKWSFFDQTLQFLAELLIFHPARAAVGLAHCTYCYSGTALIPLEMMEFLWSVGIKVQRLYGLNESCGLHSLGRPTDDQLKSCGREIPGCLTRLENTSTCSSFKLCLWGRHIFMGYLGMEEETKSALDKDGFLCTGDEGSIDTLDFADGERKST